MRLITFFVLLLFVSSCSKVEIPSPAISFGATPSELTDKETNKWIDLSDNLHKPGTMAYIYDLKTLKYVTANSDTLIYHFSGNDLLSVLIILKNHKYEDVINIFNQDNNKYHSKGNNFFEDANNVLIRVGQQDDSKAVSLLYLNNKNKEIDDIINLYGRDEILTKRDNDKFYVQILLSLMGTADAVNNMMLFGEKRQFYYNKALKYKM